MSLPLRQYKARSIPKKRKKERRTNRVRCRAHVNWVLANYHCILAGKVSKKTGEPHVCEAPLDPHHSPTKGSGGGDNNVLPLCRGGHTLIDTPNHSERSVQDEYGVDFRETATRLWSISPHRIRYERKQMEK